MPPLSGVSERTSGNDDLHRRLVAGGEHLSSVPNSRPEHHHGHDDNDDDDHHHHDHHCHYHHYDDHYDDDPGDLLPALSPEFRTKVSVAVPLRPPHVWLTTATHLHTLAVQTVPIALPCRRRPPL